jgi:GntR family transcriptional regulator
MNELNREPIYQQLNQVLRSLVRSEEFPVGSQFLTERQVAGRFRVSRATANKALSNLVAEGLLAFRKGIGTFVNARSMDYNLRALVSFTDEATAAGKRPETRVLRFEQIAARQVPEDIAQILLVWNQDPLWYMERVRLADGLPVILERRHVVASHCRILTDADVTGSIYKVWKEQFNLDVEGAEESIRAVNIRREEAKLLGTYPDTAALLVTSVGFMSGHVPLWFERTLYRGDSYEFHNRLGGIQGPSESIGKFLSP